MNQCKAKVMNYIANKWLPNFTRTRHDPFAFSTNFILLDATLAYYKNLLCIQVHQSSSRIVF